MPNLMSEQYVGQTEAAVRILATCAKWQPHFKVVVVGRIKATNSSCAKSKLVVLGVDGEGIVDVTRFIARATDCKKLTKDNGALIVSDVWQIEEALNDLFSKRELKNRLGTGMHITVRSV